MNPMVKIGLGIFAAILAFSMMSECSRKATHQIPRATSSVSSSAPQVSTSVIMQQFAKGLDLKAVSELAKKSKDAAEFEAKLNSKEEGINNIDLNDDGKVDYINVTEYGSGNKRGFSLTTELEKGKVQEIGTIEFNKEPTGNTLVQTTGNPSLYGPGHYYHSSFSATDALLLAWMFSDRPGGYSSPYGWGNYPQNYSGWNREDDTAYGSRMSTRTSGSTFRSSSTSTISQPTVSPNAAKEAAKAKAIANPTQSQRSFAARSGDSTVRSGGFGRSTGSTSSSSSGGSYGGSSSSSSRSTSSSGSSSSSSSGYRSSGSSFGSSSSSSGFGRSSSSSGSSRSGSFSGGGK